MTWPLEKCFIVKDEIPVPIQKSAVATKDYRPGAHLSLVGHEVINGCNVEYVMYGQCSA